MKKRALEAAVILAAVLIFFGIINLVTDGISENTVNIDGEFHSLSVSELSLNLMTEEGTEHLKEFTRLKALDITPFRQAVIRAYATGNPQDDLELIRQTEDTYPDCTDLDDLSFLSELTYLEELDISDCFVTNLDFLTGMKKLTSLDISDTAVTDISALSELDSVETLTIYRIPVTDYSVLNEMDSLKTVYADEEQAKLISAGSFTVKEIPSDEKNGSLAAARQLNR